MKTNFTNIYGDSVTYKCVYGNEISIAILKNGEFNCTFEKTIIESYSVNVSLLIESNLKKTSFTFSNNFQTFYFMSKNKFIFLMLSNR